MWLGSSGDVAQRLLKLPHVTWASSVYATPLMASIVDLAKLSMSGLETWCANMSAARFVNSGAVVARLRFLCDDDDVVFGARRLAAR